MGPASQVAYKAISFLTSLPLHEYVCKSNYFEGNMGAVIYIMRTSIKVTLVYNVFWQLPFQTEINEISMTAVSESAQ